jgi:hypothetical protein
MAQLIAEGRILWPPSPEGRPRLKAFLNEIKQKYTGFSSIVGEGVYTRDGTKDIDALFGERVFEFPKPVALIKQLLKQGMPDGGVVLDSFAGSGSTAQAVIELSKEDGIERNFVLIELDDDIARRVTRERLQRTAAIDGGFRFCTLGEPLFDETGSVNPHVTFPDLAAHIFFCETGSPIPKRAEGSSPFIGTFRGRAIFLLYASDSMGFASAKMGNVLTADRLEALPVPPSEVFDGTRVVYAEGCTVPEERLRNAGVTFKQVPYQIEGI